MDPLFAMIGFFIGAILMAISLFYFKGSWFVKCGIVAFYLFFATSVYSGFDHLKGWPAQGPPTSGNLISAYIIKNTAIYIWIKEDVVTVSWWVYTNKDSGRLYVLAYTKELSEKLTEAQYKMSQGYVVRFGVEEESTTSNGQQTPGPAGTNYNIEMLAPDQVMTK